MSSSPPTQTPVNAPLAPSQSSALPDLSIVDQALPSSLDAQPGGPSSPSSNTVSISKRIADLLLWHDVLSSGMALGSGLLLVFLIQVGGYSLLTLLCYTSLLQLLIQFVFINGTKFFLSFQQPTAAATSQSSSSSAASSSFPPIAAAPSFVSSTDPPPPSDYTFVSNDQVLEYSGYIADSINAALHAIATIVRCQHNALTLQVMAVLLAVSVVGRVMDGVTLLGLMWLGLFVGPKAYIVWRHDIDEQVTKLRDTVDGLREQLGRFMPEMAKSAAPKPKTD